MPRERKTITKYDPKKLPEMEEVNKGKSIYSVILNSSMYQSNLYAIGYKHHLVKLDLGYGNNSSDKF
jgi:hypothetical protein